MDRQDIPASYMAMRTEHPEVMEAYESLGEACAQGGPLDRRTVALVKLGIALGAGLEGATHSHTRKALEAGWTREEVLHATLLSVPTIGFPSMMRSRKWVQDIVGGTTGRIEAPGVDPDR
jgi:4-carboxymuconolactone decarboxylase